MSDKDLSAASGLLFMALLGLVAISRPSLAGDYGLVLLLIALVGGWALPAAETPKAYMNTRLVSVGAAGLGALFILFGVLF